MDKKVPAWEATISYLLALFAAIAVIASLISIALNRTDLGDKEKYINARCAIENGVITYSGYNTYVLTISCANNAQQLENVSIQYQLHSDYASLGGVRSLEIPSITRDRPYSTSSTAWFELPQDPMEMLDAMSIDVEIISVSCTVLK